MTGTRTLHLVASLMTPGHFRSAWRLTGADPTAALSIDYYQHLARVADDAGLDAIFLGDAPALGPDIEHGPSGSIEPFTLLTNLTAITRRVGAVITSSATFNSPYNLARRFQALDVVTKGRAAVNIVTTATPAAAANFGLPALPERAERYRRAHEFLDAVTKLWDGWEDGAVLADQESGRWSVPGSIHPADHHGEFFAVAGPLPGPPGPQGRPVVVQAGGSEGGLSLGASHSDVVFTVAQTQGKAVAFRDDIRARATAAGRRADDVKISLGVIVLVGTDEADAAARAEQLYATLDVDALARGVLTSLGLPGHALDQPIHPHELPEIGTVSFFSTGFQVSTRALIAQQPLSARDIVRRTAGGPGGGHRLVVGSPARIADDLQDWFAAGAADGFTVMFADTTVDFERFARLVVPILIDRGLFVPAAEGSTLRERLGLPFPRSGRRPATGISA